MSKWDGIPNLFGWGGGGVPGELELYLKTLDTSVRMDAGEDVKGPSVLGFAQEGVSRLSEELLARWQQES